MSSAESGKYVSRAGDKLAGAAAQLRLDFRNKVVLDVGSSTGGFTQFALERAAAKVIAVEVGTKQLHSSLRLNPKIELHEKTDIRDFKTSENPDIVLADVSFISLRQVLPAVLSLSSKNTQIIVLLKPQFEADSKELNRGIIKNDSIRRRIFKDFEQWAKKYFIIKAKVDSTVAGTKGNLERFYLLKKI
jgi:23S rRNA (cytidine1920-2'-O)/16S rRNA (cytidine1409-2'-O)-methyltransferase